MAKDKYDFIQELLENKKLTLNQRERLLLLVKDEIKNDKNIGKQLEERVKNLEILKSKDGDIGTTSNESEDTPESETTNFPKFYYNPKLLYQYLFMFNQDQILSTSCHLCDSNDIIKINRLINSTEYSFIQHRELLINTFNEFNKAKVNDNVNPDTKTLCSVYVTGNNMNGDKRDKWAEKMTINWMSPNLTEWSEQNPHTPPHTDVELNKTGFMFNAITPEIRLLEKDGICVEHIQSFSEIVLYFKYLFHIREDNSLKKIVRLNSKIEWFDKINFIYDIDETIDYFTDISKLVQAYRIIVKMILEVTEKRKLNKPVVEIKFKPYEKGFFIFYKSSKLRWI
ncbi:MAG: hypothetical protein IPN09_17025 [Bacteroidetes bacterium]|nr:hypothetical protein [Bacteroidota bacterium]